MAINYLNSINLNKNEILQGVIENQPNDAAAGASPVEGQLYFNTTNHVLMQYNGASWEEAGGGVETLVAVNSSDTYVNLTPTSAATGAVTITADLNATAVTGEIDNTKYLRGDNKWASVTSIYDWSLQTDSGVGAKESITSGDIVTLGGDGSNIAVTNAGLATTITLSSTAVTAGSYTYAAITVDAQGRITTASSGTAPVTPSNATITLTAGDGLTTGGAFTLDQSGAATIAFNIGSGDGIAVSTDSIAADVDNATIQITSNKIAAKTAAVTDAGTALATGDQIYDFVTGQIANIPSGLSFEGSWNADTDAPDLSGATPDNGQFWIVSVPGATDLSGITDWKVGDWAIYVSTGAGSDGWQKVDNTSTLSGSGVANQLTYWTGTANVAGDAGLTYNATDNNLTVGGTITSSGGNSGEWNTAYGNSITGLAVAGTTTKTLTATQQDGGALTASWTDNDSGGTVTNVATTLPITGGPFTDTGTIGITTASLGVIGAGAVAQGTGISVAYVTGIATVTNTQTNAVNTYAGTITDSVSGTTFDHGLGEDVIVQLYDATNKDTVYADVVRNGNYLNISFSSTPTNSVRVLVQKIG